MIAIGVDDEEIMLNALERAISASSDITSVIKFSDSQKTIDFVKNNSVDVAFLDINMYGIGGLKLAENILKIKPECKIIFCTGYEEYAIAAFKLHASGYLLKPITAEDVQKEIDVIKGIQQKEKLLEVKCFGNFEVFSKGERVLFKRSKTKELFAYLIDRNGASVTSKEICAVLFADNTDDSKNVAYVRQLVLDLKNTLKSFNAERVFRHEAHCYRVDTALIKCDYLSFLKTGKPNFFGEYISQYSWAEDTCAMLNNKK